MDIQKDLQLKIYSQIFFLHAVSKGYAKFKKDGISIKAHSYRVIIVLNKKIILQKFSNIIYKIIKYYNKRILHFDFRSIIFVYRKSCALTLSKKYKIKTASASFKKFEG